MAHWFDPPHRKQSRALAGLGEAPTSFLESGKYCGIEQFEGRPEAWEKYCDCMFLRPVQQDVYYCNGLPIPRLPFLGSNEAEARRTCGTGAFEKRWQTTYERTEEWRKCVSKQCLLPTGCYNSYARDNDGFNLSPFMLSPPWTDFGAAARGVRKRNPSDWMGVGQALSVPSPENYTPLKLWVTYWTNPGLYFWNVAKIQLVPGVGQGVLAALTAAHAGGASPVPVGLVPLALAQVALERKDIIRDFLKPTLTGGMGLLATAGKAIGPFFGGQWAEVAGVVAAKFAQDQIDTGEIDKVASEVARGIIIFLAKSGEQLGRLIQQAVTSAGAAVNAGTVPGVFALMRETFRTLAGTESFSTDARNVFDGIASAMGVGYAISDGVARGWSPLQIIDAIFFELFGVRFQEVQMALSKGAGELRTLLTTQSRTAMTPESALKRLEVVAAVLGDIARVLADIASKVGMGVEKLSASFSGAVGLMQEASAQAKQVIHTATPAGAAGQPLPPAIKPPPGTPQAKSASGSALALAAAGAVVGTAAAPGPGTLIGAAAGLVAAALSKPKVQPVPTAADIAVAVARLRESGVALPRGRQLAGLDARRWAQLGQLAGKPRGVTEVIV